MPPPFPTAVPNKNACRIKGQSLTGFHSNHSQVTPSGPAGDSTVTATNGSIAQFHTHQSFSFTETCELLLHATHTRYLLWGCSAFSLLPMAPRVLASKHHERYSTEVKVLTIHIDSPISIPDTIWVSLSPTRSEP